MGGLKPPPPPPPPLCSIPRHAADSTSAHDSTTILASQPSLPSLPSLNPHHHVPLLLLHHCLATLHGHSSYVAALAVHGDLLLSGSSDQDIRLWQQHSFGRLDASSCDPATPACFAVAAARSPVKALAFSGDCGLFSAHQDGKIRAWRIERRDVVHSRRWKVKAVAVLPTAADRFLSLLSPGNYVQVRRHKKCTWVNHVDAVSGLAVSRDGSLLYSVSWDRTLKVWRAADFKCVESVAGAHHDAVNAVVVSPDGLVYTGSADTTIKVWGRRQGATRHSLVQTLERHKSAVNALALSADGSVLYSGACDRSVVIWEGRGGSMAAAGALRGHRKAILCLAAAGDMVCSGSADKSVRVWMRRGGGEAALSYSCLAVLEGHGGPVKSLAMAEDDEGQRGSSIVVFSGGLDCDVKVWRVFVPISVEEGA